MKNKFISLLLAFLMLVTALPVPAIAQEVGPDSEELVELDYEFERIDGQDYIKVTLPANSVEIVEDPYAMRPMSITDSVPTEGGAGHLINWGAGVLWYDYNNAYPPDGKEYVAKLSKNVNGKNIVIAKTENIATAATTTEDMDPDKDTTYQFITTDDYEKGDEKLTGLVVTFPVKLDQNIIYFVNQKPKSGKLNNSTNTFNLVFLAVSRLTSPTYTAEWDKTTEALQPTIKGKLITGKNQAETFEVFKENGKYGTICNKPPKAYVDEKDKDGKLIEDIVYDRKGSLDIKSVLWSLGSQPVMKGEFLSYETSNFDTSSFETTKTDHPLGNRKGMIPAHYAKTANGVGKDKTPPYFYNLVGDNDHMWRFQLKEGLEVKFNTGVGSATQGGEKGQDIGQASTIAYGEKFDSNLKGAFSENTFTLPTATPVAPKLNKNNVNLTFKGWKLVQGLEVPVNPQKIESDGEGKQTLTEVTPDYATTDALKTALTAADFKGFSEKNPVFYAIFGQTQGKAKIEYLDDKGANLLNADTSVKIDGQDYKTEKLGDLNQAVTATTTEAPQFNGYAISKVEIEPATGAKYVDPATATIKFVYKVKATTDDKSSDKDYIKVTFNANEGHFGETTTDTTKDVYVLKDKATFADAKEKVSDPNKDNATFKEWQTAATGGTKVADNKTLSTADETFYANYTTKAQGKATIEYLDVKTGQAIKDEFRAEDASKYPAEKEGNQGKKVTVEEFTAEKAPEFVGYEFNRVEVSPKDGTYALPASSVIKVYYNKLADVIKDDTPDNDDDKPTGYVTVKFEPGTNGTLEGTTKFYVNPKADPVKTMAEITQPTIKANTGYKVADPKWKDAEGNALVTTTQISKDLTYIAQYTDGDDVIPVPDPSNPPEKPDGYVTVTFDLDGKGTTTDTRVFFVNPNKDVTLTAPTVTGIGDYKQKTGDDAWSPKFVTKAKYTEDKKFIAQYTFDKDVVPQGPGEDKPIVPKDYVKVQFKQGDHGTIDQNQTTIYWVNPKVEVDLTEKAPTVKADPEYKHTGWDKELKATFATATDITAQYKKKVVDTDPSDKDYVKVDFKVETHGKIKDGEKKEFWVLKDETVEIKTPAVEPNANYAFEKWDPAVQTSYSENKTHNAVFVYTGDDVVPQKPGEEKPDVPENFVEVEFNKGANGTIADTETVTYWVNPAKKVTVTAPKVTANDGYKHAAWTYKLKTTDTTEKEVKTLESVTDKFTEKTTITAKYLKKVLEEEPQTDKDAYVKVTFKAETNGKFAENKTEKSVWVLKDTPVTVTEPTVIANSGWKFIKFDPAVKDSYSKDTEHKAQYKKIIVTEDPKDKDYVKITFDPAAQGTIKAGSNAEVWILKDETIDPKDITPELEVKEKYAFEKWDPEVKTKYDTDTTHKAIYKYNGDDVVPQKPGEDKPNVPDNFVKVTFVAGDHGSIANTETYIFWVNPGKQVTLNAPTVVANEGYKHVAWTYKLKATDTDEKTTSGPTALTTVTDTFTEKETTITAKYLKKVVTDDPHDTENYVKLTFKAEDHGDFGKDSETQQLIKEKYVWVLKNTDVKVTAPTVTPNKGYTFTEWSPAVKNNYDADTTHTAQYVDKDKIIDDPTTPAAEEGYVRLTFDATKDGKINGKQTKVIDVLDTLKYSDKDLQDKIGSIKAIPTDETKKFNAWTPAVPADDTAVTEATYTASYVDKDKIIDVTPGSEDEDPDNAYVRFIFNAVGTDKESNTVNGTVKGNAKYAFDVLKGTKFNDNDLQTKINSLKAVAKDYKFIKWTPDVLNNDTLVEAGNVTKHEYTATYEKLEKIIDVTDPTVDPDEYHVRLTFDATKDGKIGDVNGQQTKAIDVLKGTPYTDRELIDKIANIKAIPVKDDNGTTVEDTNKEFNAWSPLVPTTGYVNTETFKASYKTKTPGQESIDISATKTWQDADGSAPTFTTPEVKFELWRKVGQAGAEEIVKQASALTNNSVTFSGVDKYNANNVEYTYFVKEVFTNAAEKDNWILEGDGVVAITDKKGTVNLTNKLKGDPTNPDQPNPDTDKVATLTITKKLENDPVVQAQTNGMRRAPKQALKFSFKVTGPYGYEETFELTANESKTLENLAYGDYTVVETDSKGYTPEYSKAKETLTKDSPSGSITVTNKNKESTDPQKPNENIIDVTVKKVWSGVPQGITTPQVKIELWRKGYDLNNKEFEQKVGEFTTAVDNTAAEETKKFEKLAKQDPSGRDFTYYAVEPTVPENYTASYSDDNLTVTNTYKAPEKEYTVTYDKGADAATGTMNPVKVAENTDYTILGNGFNYADHDFTGWKIYGTNEIKQPGDVIEITKDEKLIAQWKETETPEPAPTTFTIKYISMDTEKGTVSPASETVAITGGTIAGSTATATTGNKFVKWMDTDGNTKSTDANFVPTERKDATYIAVFEADTSVTPDPEPTEFTIKYVSTDTTKGTVSPATETVAITGGTITGSTATATTGNKFVKWIDTDGNTKSTDANFVPTERKDATYIAVFEADTSVTPDPEPTEFTIKYVSTDAAKGTVSPASETVAITGGTITGSTATATTGNKFVKWIDTDGNTKSTEANFVPTERKDATYIAVFEKEEVTPEPQPEPTYFVIKYISADTNQGTVSPESETVETEGGKITGSTAFARTGYRFVKWLGTDGFTKSTDERFVPTAREAATYIAVFEKIGSVTPPEPWPPTPGPGPEPDPRPWPPYRPHRPDPRPYDRDDRDDRDDDTVRKPEDTRPVLNHEAYMFGYTDGTVRPNGNITRAEAAALITRLLGIEAYASAAKPNFPDTPSAWYNKAINAAVERGIMKGYPDGRFRPNAPITRAEFTQMISTIDNKPYGVAPFADVVGHWAERPIGSEYQAGRITGYPDGLFRPNAYITRCEAVVILNKIFERNYDELSAINAINAERIKRFIDLAPSFWGYNDMVEATNSHSFKRRVEGRIQEDWVLVK